LARPFYRRYVVPGSTRMVKMHDSRHSASAGPIYTRDKVPQQRCLSTGSTETGHTVPQHRLNGDRTHSASAEAQRRQDTQCLSTGSTETGHMVPQQA